MHWLEHLIVKGVMVMFQGHRRMSAYGEREHSGKYVLDNYNWSRNHHKAVSIRRWKRNLKKKARAARRRMIGGCYEI